jgi:hypothetical protein
MAWASHFAIGEGHPAALVIFQQQSGQHAHPPDFDPNIKAKPMTEKMPMMASRD